MRLWLLVFAAGCWRGTDAPPTTPDSLPRGLPVALAPHGVSCDLVAAHLHGILQNGSDPVLARRADPIRDTVLRRCRADSWSPELRGCLARSSSLDDSNDCEDLASAAQQEALDADIEALEEAE